MGPVWGLHSHYFSSTLAQATAPGLGSAAPECSQSRGKTTLRDGDRDHRCQAADAAQHLRLPLGPQDQPQGWDAAHGTAGRLLASARLSHRQTRSKVALKDVKP